MKHFTELFLALDRTTRSREKTAALVQYFGAAPLDDASWAVYYLMGNRVRRTVSARLLREWCAEITELPLWMIEECYATVGDLAETLARLLPPPTDPVEFPFHELIEEHLTPLIDADEATKKKQLFAMWNRLEIHQRFIWNKLITGGFRVGVAKGLVTKALAQVTDTEPAEIAYRLMGEWKPTSESMHRLLTGEGIHSDIGRPYPFFLAHPIEQQPSNLGPANEWAAEWKWDGIRAQVIRRGDQTLIWSRGEELIGERYPEVLTAAEKLPNGTVLDGELLAWKQDKPLPFGELQRRISRKTIGKKLLSEVPVTFMAYDCMEAKGEDIRNRSFEERQAILSCIVSEIFRLSHRVIFEDWETLTRLREESRTRGVEGLMLKRCSSPYQAGRKKGDWWKWKVDPYSIDAVLIYAQAGHGRRANLFTDYTFAVWKEDELVPIAKAYSGLTDREIREVDHWIRQHTLQKFGPVRSVDAKLVFELHFEGINRSARHKSGIAVRFPRIHRWRKDKPASEADTLSSTMELIQPIHP